MGSATVLYAATNEGVVALQSDDSDRWATRSQGLKSWSVPKLDALTSQPGRVVAGTRGDGVWVSDDFGETWEHLEDGLPGTSKQFPAAIVFERDDPDRIYIGLSSGDLYASQDAGDSWRQLETELPSLSDLRCVRA